MPNKPVGDRSSSQRSSIPEPSELLNRVRTMHRDRALHNALLKRSAGVPSYTIPEAAALCSVSQEHLYRLVKAGVFPAVRMRRGAEQGRYIVPASVIEELFGAVAAGTEPVDLTDWAAARNAHGGAA